MSCNREYTKEFHKKQMKEKILLIENTIEKLNVQNVIKNTKTFD